MNKTVSINSKSYSKPWNYCEPHNIINSVEDEQSPSVESHPAVVSSDDEPFTDAEDCQSPVEESTSPPMTSLEAASSDPEEGCASSVSDSIPMDIGVLLKNGTLNTLTQSNKLKLLNHTPDTNVSYPTTFMNGCNRRFKPEWVKNHSWLHYSASEDGIYCKACVLFAPSEIKRQKLGTLVTKPFSLWTIHCFE